MPAPLLDRSTRTSAILLQALLSTQAILAVCPLLCAALARAGVDARWAPTTLAANAGVAIWLSIPEGFLWAWWASSVYEALREAELSAEDQGPGWLWPAAFIPCVSAYVRLGVVGRLGRTADPSRLSPILVERASDGGFREDPLVHEEAAPMKQAWVTVWWWLWAIGMAPTLVVFAASPDSLGGLAPVFLPSSLAGRMLVSAVTANLTELTRRHRHRSGTEAGVSPVAVLRSMTMRSVRWLLPVAVACSLLAPRSAPAQMRPMLIPGLPVPVMMPAGVLAGGVPAGQVPVGVPGAVPGATVPGAVPAGQSGIGVVPPGSVDGNGFLTQGFMRVEAEQMLAELVGALTPANKAKVQGIPFAFDAQTSEFNAYAGCENGVPYMAMTLPLLRAVGHIAEARASDEVFGSRRTDVYTRQAAEAMNASAPVPDPAPGFYSPQEANDPRKLGRQRIIFDEMVGFVLGHELAHHYLGHTGCANGSGGGGLDPGILLRLPSRAIPVFNQPIEAAADTNGTNNVLDLGATRQGGLSEQGAVLTLQFFGALQQLSPSSILLGVMRTHPQPQLRIPFVQQTAQQWRTRRASGQTGPTNSSPFPFPFPIPFLTK